MAWLGSLGWLDLVGWVGWVGLVWLAGLVWLVGPLVGQVFTATEVQAIVSRKKSLLGPEAGHAGPLLGSSTHEWKPSAHWFGWTWGVRAGTFPRCGADLILAR